MTTHDTPGLSEHRCDTCPDCVHNGNRCCGCYDGACCKTGPFATPERVTTLLHSLNRGSGVCRCDEGPLTAPEWVAHYKAQSQPTVTIERASR